ncbi:hypothetical protein EMIT0P258_40274 [Pseudomonas sp. IT-P258]
MLIFPGSTSMHPVSVMQPATTKRAPVKAPVFIQACVAFSEAVRIPEEHFDLALGR